MAKTFKQIKDAYDFVDYLNNLDDDGGDGHAYDIIERHGWLDLSNIDETLWCCDQNGNIVESTDRGIEIMPCDMIEFGERHFDELNEEQKAFYLKLKDKHDKMWEDAFKRAAKSRDML